MSDIGTRYGWMCDPAHPDRSYHGGKIVPDSQMLIHVTSHGFQYSHGGFEGVLITEASPEACKRLGTGNPGYLIPFWPAHRARLMVSSRTLRMWPWPIDPQELDRVTAEIVALNAPLNDRYLRHNVARGQIRNFHRRLGVDPRANPVIMTLVTDNLSGYLAAGSVGKGFTIAIHPAYRRPSPDGPLGVGKISPNYGLGGLAKDVAISELGATDMLLLAPDGESISECTGNNVILYKDGVLTTPDESSGCLQGITRDVLLGLAPQFGLKVEKPRRISHWELLKAHMIILVGTAVGAQEMTCLRHFDYSGRLVSHKLVGSAANPGRDLAPVYALIDHYRDEILTGKTPYQDDSEMLFVEAKYGAGLMVSTG